MFVSVPDATQNATQVFQPVPFTQTRSISDLPLTRSNTYTVNPSGILTEFVGKVHVVGGDNKAPFAVMGSKPAVQIRGITMEEVKTHKQKNDCWVVIEGKVYDVTNYIRYHPGGDILLDAAGKDGTALYQHYHPWVNVQALIGKYQVGYLTR